MQLKDEGVEASNLSILEPGEVSTRIYSFNPLAPSTFICLARKSDRTSHDTSCRKSIPVPDAPKNSSQHK